MQASTRQTSIKRTIKMKLSTTKAFHRSPFLEETKVIRCPVSLIPRIQKLLAERRAVVAIAAKRMK